MSVVAIKEGIIVSDRQGTSGNIKCACTKLRVVQGPNSKVAVAITGTLHHMAPLLDWWNFANPVGEVPVFQKTSDWSRLILAYPSGLVEVIEDHGYTYRIDGNKGFYAFGSGREVAVGAMAVGATAEIAVRTAAAWSADCGMGFDRVVLEKLDEYPIQDPTML